jgi:TonB family protein
MELARMVPKSAFFAYESMKEQAKMIATLMALTMATTAFSGATAKDAGEWLSPTEFPFKAFHGNELSGIRVALTVDAGGRPVRCQVTRSSGFEEMDENTCTAAMRSARFTPARDAQGNPVPALWTTGARWTVDEIGNNNLVEINSDMIVSARAVPAGEARLVTIDRLIGGDARVEGCTVRTSSGAAEIDALACESAMQQPTPQVITAEGPAPRAVATQTLVFVRP